MWIQGGNSEYNCCPQANIFNVIILHFLLRIRFIFNIFAVCLFKNYMMFKNN